MAFKIIQLHDAAYIMVIGVNFNTNYAALFVDKIKLCFKDVQILLSINQSIQH